MISISSDAPRSSCARISASDLWNSEFIVLGNLSAVRSCPERWLTIRSQAHSYSHSKFSARTSAFQKVAHRREGSRDTRQAHWLLSSEQFQIRQEQNHSA